MTTNELDALLLEDSQPEVMPDLLKRITATAAELTRVQAQCVRIEEALAEAKKEEQRLAQQVLPTLMDEAQVQELTLETGERITRSQDIYASVSKANANAVADWLDAHHFGALVKNAITIPLPRGGEPERFARLRTLLAGAGYQFEENRTVHPQTLKAFVRESIEAGRELPSTISTHIQPTVKVKS